MFNKGAAGVKPAYMIGTWTPQKNMATKSVNNEKKARAIRETKREEFVKVFNAVKALFDDGEFMDTAADTTGNGLYKFTTTLPQDMTGVKSFDDNGLKWYKVPTSDYRNSLTSYIGYRLTKESKASSAANKAFAELSLEQKQALLAKLAELGI